MIYAFKKGNKVQTLDEHIEKCLNVLDKIRNSKLWSSVFNYEFVKRTIVFHDIGKVFYQKNKKNLSFVGHEFISAYVFWKVFGDCFIGDEKKLELLYLFPIIFHHHTMRIKGGGSRKGRLEALESISITSPTEEVLFELKKILMKYISYEYVKKTVKALIHLEILEVKNKIESKINDIWREFHGRFARNCLRLLLITMTCDYEGSKSRGKPTSFGRILEEFLEYYGSR